MLAAFTTETGIKVTVKSDGMAKIVSDIKTATPIADVIVLPVAFMDGMETEGSIVADSRADLGRVTIGLAVKKGAAHPDISTPAKLAALLTKHGMGRSKLTICEAMGGSREQVRTTEAQDFALDNVAALNTIALEVIAEHGARILPRAAGLPDAWFEHDGQITKREIRAMTLSSLAPRRGELLWT